MKYSYRPALSGLRLLTAAWCLASLIAVTACQGPAVAPTPAAPQWEPKGASEKISGRIRDVLYGGQSIYLEIESDGVSKWATITEGEIEKGGTVVLAPGTVVRNFTSGKIRRTFRYIVFSPAILEYYPPGTPVPQPAATPSSAPARESSSGAAAPAKQ